MLKHIKNLLKRGLASNLAFGLIALPISTNITVSDTPDTSLIIPQQKLDIAFNIPQETDQNKTQVPLVFSYVSQGFSAFHPALDLVAAYGTSIKPFMAGTVEEAGFSPFGYGNEVLIDHQNGLKSLYAHLSKIKVKKGDTVNLDTELGMVGLTGHTTGPHLHFEIHKNEIPVNPLTFLPHPLIAATN